MSRKTTRQLVPLKQAAGDYVDEDYGILCPSGDDDDQLSGPRVAVVVLGVFHILLALASIALGIAAICTAVSGYYIGYGIWCGFMVGATTRLYALFRRRRRCLEQGRSGPPGCLALARWAGWSAGHVGRPPCQMLKYRSNDLPRQQEKGREGGKYPQRGSRGQLPPCALCPAPAPLSRREKNYVPSRPFPSIVAA